MICKVNELGPGDRALHGDVKANQVPAHFVCGSIRRLRSREGGQVSSPREALPMCQNNGWAQREQYAGAERDELPALTYGPVTMDVACSFTAWSSQ